MKTSCDHYNYRRKLFKLYLSLEFMTCSYCSSFYIYNHLAFIDSFDIDILPLMQRLVCHKVNTEIKSNQFIQYKFEVETTDMSAIG